MDTMTMSPVTMARAVLMVAISCSVMAHCNAYVMGSTSSAYDKGQFLFRDSRQEKFVKELDNYIITVPTRVTSEGNYVTHQLHAKHSLVKRHATETQTQPRSATDTGARAGSGNDVNNNNNNNGNGNDAKQKDTPTGSDDTNSKNIITENNDTRQEQKYNAFSGRNDVTENDPDVIHYRIPVQEGREVVVALRENVKLLSPGAVVERRGRRYGNASDSRFESLQHTKGCHLAGHVLGDSTSRVALAACNGLSGFLHTDGEHYLIEPVKGHDSASDPHPHHHPHIVYKRSAVPGPLGKTASDSPASSPADSTCGVKDDINHVLRRRERWQKRHRRHTAAELNEDDEEEVEEDEEDEERRVKRGTTRSRRKKRSISSEKNVETLVVVDPDMMKYYQNEDIENYVLTVMNMVATLFHDASIGNAVNIVIVRMLLLKDPDEELDITHHADKTLRSFCKWQKTVNFRDDDHPNHHDVALLLTRRNICNRMNQPCSTLGLAQVSGMCQPHRSCNINEDTGLSLAWTVTHELGHNFAMKHDTKHNDCASPVGEMFVMAPHLSWDLVPSHWSPCSRRSVTEFLDRDWGYCLDDEPGHHDFTYPVLPAGTMYDADHQCRLLYGEDAALCGGIQDLENICSTLWCRVNNKCSTKLQPAAEGTICGTNRWCYAGKCVEIGERRQSIDGEWGQWGSWTSCSRSCGAGVSHSQRHCNHPPPSSGGNYCLGERKRYRICNTEACPDDGVSFRQVQCSEFDKIPYKGNQYDWIPIPTPETPCQLHCKPRDMFFSVLLKDIVTDGTPCVPGARQKCISGRCRHVGCDWEIDSSATEDRCGVCYGDGSTCTTVKQQFNETKEHGYVEATIIPRGARNIRVEEVASASNFLALANAEGEYYLNGHWFIQWSGDYEMAGTVVHYDRQGNKESFQAQGPLKEPLKIMLLMQTHNPGVQFEYTVPKENATDTREPEFRWDFTDWSHCTLSCGGGTQRTEVVCMEKEAGRVDDMFCDQSTKPDDRLRHCNDHLCPARWWTGPWQHCSVTCGDNGSHKRSVMCVRSLGADEQIALEDSHCDGLRKPKHTETCRTKEPCPGNTPVWMTGNWTVCNGNPCAIQTRSTVCSDVTVGCDPFTRPVTSRPCTNVTCGKWETEDWSECTRTCRGGVQYRKVTCVGGSTCDLELEPPGETTCGDHPCPTDDNVTTPATSVLENAAGEDESIVLSTGEDGDGPSLKADQAGESSNYVLGESESSISLDTVVASKNQVVGNSEMGGGVVGSNGDDKENSEKKSEAGSPSSHSKNKHRHHGKNHHNKHHLKNQNTGHANTNNNDPQTETGHHNPEEKDSNNGGDKKEHANPHDTRNKPSHHKHHQEQSETVVIGQDNPAGSAEETLTKNTSDVDDLLEEVLEGSESEESQEGGDGDDDGGEGEDGDGLAEEQKGVKAEDDFEWYAGEWRRCSSQCGDGVQTRAVSCFRKTTGVRVDGEFCSIHSKPSAIQECNTAPCVTWLSSQWSQCSATCGYAMRTREVTCPNGGRCDPKFKPRHIEVCSSLSPCIAWVTGDWSKCSKSCDGGTQKRMVQCVNVTSQHVSQACDGGIRPSERQSCNVDECPQTDAAFTVNCESNEMSYKVCRMLKKVGLCHKDYVQAKCCRTCADHKRKSPANRISADLR